MKKPLLLLAVVALLVSGCGFFFGPGYSSRDTAYFAEPPIIVKSGEQYALRWRYGSWGFYFNPRYEVRKGALWFSLQGTSSSGNLKGREAEMPIEGEGAIEALKKGGAFWWEPDGTLLPLEVRETSGGVR
jgi:hypothetical protein